MHPIPRSLAPWLARAAALVALLAALGWGVHHAVAAAKPKARGPARGCYDCDQESKKEFARKFVHAPVAKNQCDACHLNHGFQQRLVLKKPANELCFECHADLKKVKQVHGPVGDGDCLPCHAQADKTKHAFKPAATGAKLCETCHDPVEKKKSLHKPVTEDCVTCHSAHGSDEKGCRQRDPRHSEQLPPRRNRQQLQRQRA